MVEAVSRRWLFEAVKGGDVTVSLFPRGNHENGLVSFLPRGAGGGADKLCAGGAGGGGDHGTEGSAPERPCRGIGDLGGKEGGRTD